MLNNREITKYKRHLLLPEIGMSGQLKLKQQKVLVIGAGGLGCPVLQYLTAAGIGEIGIVDFDYVDASNLQRQVLYTENDIGKAKAIVAQEKLQRQNTSINIISYPIKLNIENAISSIQNYNIIVDCTDNYSSRYLINDVCVLLNKTMIYGSIHRFEGQVSVFNYYWQEKKGPTYRCLFPTPPKLEGFANCNDSGVLGVLPGIIGTMQANEVIKITTGVGRVLCGRLLCLNALTMEVMHLEIERNLNIANFMPNTSEEILQWNYSLGEDVKSKQYEIDHIQLEKMMDTCDDILFIDVRESNEVIEPRPFRGIEIPFSEIRNNIHQIRTEKTTIFYCKSGKRSADAIKILLEYAKPSNIYSLKGGLDAWKTRNLNQQLL